MVEHSYNPGAPSDDKFKPPYPWESKVTTCIAAVCNTIQKPPRIILCTDWQASGPIGISDTAYKQPALGKGWHCLTAGSENEINSLIFLLEKNFGAAKKIDETNIVLLVKESLAERKREKANEHTIGKFGLSYSDFLDIGKNKLPDSIFRTTIEAIEKITLGASLIIVGFVETDNFIIETTKYCEVRLPTDFSTIGEGAILAASSLYQREYWDIHPLGKALYCVYEAKKNSERVASVGESTLISILGEDGRSHSLKKEGHEHLEGLYRKHGPQSLPTDMEFSDDFIE